MNLSNQDVQLAQQFFVSSATQQHPLGTRGCDTFGRVFRYVKAGAADLIAGTVIQSPAPPAGQLTTTVNTTGLMSVGNVFISITCASSVAAGFYNDGYLVIASGTGQGFTYTVNQHPAVSTGAVGLFRLYDEDALVVAITNSSTVSLFPNKYNGVVVMPATTATGVVVGVASYVITLAQFGWIQTWGPCGVLGSTTNAIGSWGISPATSCGQVSAATAANLLVGQVIGHLMQANVAAQVVMVDLKISP